jgi:hypothetical protein
MSGRDRVNGPAQVIRQVFFHLRGKGVNDVLVNKGRIAVHEGVTAQLIVGVWL